MYNKTRKPGKGKSGFTLIEIMVALLLSSLLTMAVYSIFISQQHAYTVQDQVVEMEQNARAAIDMVRRELRMAGYNAMGVDLINNLSDFVPSSFIPSTAPLTVNLDDNPKITEGAGTEPDMITFLSVLPSANNPTTFASATAAGYTQLTLTLNATETNNQYNVGDILHIGTCSEYAKVTAISGNILTIDTVPGTSGTLDGLTSDYAAGSGIGEISVISYAVYNEVNDSSYAHHTQGHPVLKRNVNGGGFQPITENITDMQLQHLGSGEVQLTLSSRTGRADSQFQTNSGYRSYAARAKIKVRNADTVAVGTNCTVPSAPSNLILDGLDATYPCKIHITWDAVTAPCAVSGYKIYYGTSSCAYAYSIDVASNVTDYVLDVTALKSCAYYVSMVAINSGGNSDKATEASIVDIVAPATPSGFSAVNVNGVERQVVLSWNASTDCDLQGYNTYGREDGGTQAQLNSAVIPGEIATYTDTDFDPIDCATYYYTVAALDYCPNTSTQTSEVSASPTAPNPPTDPGFSISGVRDTISWTLSSDDFDVNGNNYVVSYKVYDELNALLAILSADTDTWTSSSNHAYYDVSVVDACGNESSKLRISSSCSDVPDIIITEPNSGETVSDTVNIYGTATAVDGRSISSMQLKIDDEPWIDLSGTSSWSHDWNTNPYSDDSHIITVKAVDSEGCYNTESVEVTVDNAGETTDTLYCKLYACIQAAPGKDKNNIAMVAYVYDQNDNPVSDAVVTVLGEIGFGGGDGSPIIPETSPSGYYGDEITSTCELRTDGGEICPVTGLAILSKHTYGSDDVSEIAITVEKTGFISTSCSRSFVIVDCSELPAIIIDSPSSGSSLSGTVTIEGSANAPSDRTIDNVQVNIDAGVWNDAFGMSDWSYDWNTTVASNETHIITVKAVDSEGCEQTAFVEVLVDNSGLCDEPPVITITAPVSRDTVADTVTISGTATAASERDISVQLKIDEGSWSDVSGTTDWSYDWNTTSYSGGNHTITVKVEDSEGCENTEALVVSVAKLYCKLYACKYSGNNYVYLAVYVFDQNNEPVTGATVTVDIKVGSNSNVVPEINSGYYGGSSTPTCGNLETQGGDTLSGAGISIRSHNNKKAVSIKVTVVKGDLSSTCTRSFSD
jgi:type IV pilus assembly protein PilW